MAGFDYLKCGECGKRLIYDGDWEIRNALEGQPITCYYCVRRMKKKIAVLKKHDRRRH